MDEDHFKDLLFGDLGTQGCPGDILFDDSDDDILFSNHDEQLYNWDFSDTASSPAVAGMLSGQHIYTNGATNAYKQSSHHLTEVIQSPVRDRS
jgi:meiotic recombination protein SPO11